MTTRPFTLKPHEVRGIIDGRLTQIRRPIKPQPSVHDCGRLGKVLLWPGKHPPATQTSNQELWIREGSPFGAAGGLLWCRESWAMATGTVDRRVYVRYKDGIGKAMAAPDSVTLPINASTSDRWRPSTTMPQWASRSTVEVLDIRAHRLHDITTADIQASGTQLLFNLETGAD